jgi:hypothetical protein
MSRTEKSQALPIANYEPAIARAVRWLGNRYLLAAPINAARRQPSSATPRKLGAR